MNLLVITQKVDKNDSNLGFFHEWLRRLAGRVEHLYVICLEKGEYQLPVNVTVLSLGKEAMRERSRWARKIAYSLRFRSLIRQYQHKYDGVFVHMNPEYAVLGGRFWKKHKKKILLWYVHKSVNWWLRAAEKRVDKIFTASLESFRLPSEKVEVAGHGIAVEAFTSSAPARLETCRFITVGRIAPVKDLETLIQAVAEFSKHHPELQLKLDIIGEAIQPADFEYQKVLQELVARLDVKTIVRFLGGMPQAGVIDELRGSHLFLHSSQTGSIDKSALEALASGRIVATSSEAYADAAREGIVYAFPPHDHHALALTIEKIWQSGILKTVPNEKAIAYVRERHNLDVLIQKIIGYFSV